MLLRNIFSGTFMLAAISLVGCAPVEKNVAFPDISFAHLPQIKLNVARVEIENLYVSPAAHPHVEHRFPVSPAATASNWGRDRLRAAGRSGVARVVIRRASVIEQPMKRSTGLEAVFTRDQSERYEAIIDMLVEIRDANGRVRVTVESAAKRSRSVSEDISPNERSVVWFQMTERLMGDLNKSLESQIRIHMKDWVSY